MDEDLIRRIRVAAHSLDAPRERMLDLIAELGGASDAQEADTVVVDREELASLLLAVAQPPSFGDALRAEGFQPAVGAKIAPRKIYPRLPGGLKLYPPEQTGE
ncbi:hypothetical protein ACLBXM_08100 [Xanthobacteraceae bacterium A53D]